MGSSRFGLKVADEESKSVPNEFPRSHWSNVTGRRVIERYLSAIMVIAIYGSFLTSYHDTHVFLSSDSYMHDRRLLDS